MSKFKIGDTAYYANFNPLQEKWTTICPECLGTLKLRVILATEEELSIDCECCDHGGYYGSQGKMQTYEPTPNARQIKITGLEDRGEGNERYYFGGSYLSDSEQLFVTEAEAITCANELAAQYSAKQEESLHRKKKQKKKWSWHVTYHRREMKRSLADAERHAAKLGIALEKAKATK